MVIFFTILMGIMMGTAVGVIFEKSKVIDPEQLIGQFQLRRFTMLKVFLSAIGTGIVVYFFFNLFALERLNWKVFSLLPDLLGGALLGAGIALAGTCPSTLFGQLGAGYKDARFVFLGAVTGAIIFYYSKPALQIWIKECWPHEKLRLDELGLGYNLTAVLVVCSIVFVLYLLERYRPWRVDTECQHID